MKAFSIISITVLLFASQQVAKASLESQMLVLLARDCLEKTATTEADVVHFIEGNLPETDEQKCLVACVGKKFGIVRTNSLSEVEVNSVKIISQITADNKIDEQIVVDHPELSVTEEVVAACKDAAVHTDECEAADDILKCVFSKSDETGISFISDFLAKQ